MRQGVRLATAQGFQLGWVIEEVDQDVDYLETSRSATLEDLEMSLDELEVGGNPSRLHFSSASAQYWQQLLVHQVPMSLAAVHY